MINIDHVTLRSPTNRTGVLLNDVNCSFDRGTITLLVGQTGSGKTTLLNALAGLIPLDTGSIYYDGLSLWNGKRVNEAVNLKISMAFQYPERQLFAEHIGKEFNYSLRPLRLTKQEITSRSHEALGLMHLPETILNESVLTLSNGTKRKAALATTLATKPQWLLLDEPTAGIDPGSIPVLLHALGSYTNNEEAGVIIASHDLDTFLPLADRVVVLHKGAVAAICTPQDIYANPGLLLQNHVGLPASLQISMALKERGVSLTGSPLSPHETAKAIMRVVNQPYEVRRENCSFQLHEDAGRMHVQEKERLSSVAVLEGGSPDNESLTEKPLWNPIAAWFFYILLSTGILLQDHWSGIALAAITTLLLIRLSGASYRRVMKPAKPFVYFILLSVLISGLKLDFWPDHWMLSRIYFSFSSAELTGLMLIRFLLVMMLGILFALTISQRMMQLGLEQAFSVLHRYKIPVSVFTFSASLMLRFIPLLSQEIERMSIIMKARGKSRAKHGSLRLREVHVFLIPLILSVLQNAEDLAIALEARGYKLKSHFSRVPLKYRSQDLWLMAVGVILLGVFAVIDYYM